MKIHDGVRSHFLFRRLRAALVVGDLKDAYTHWTSSGGASVSCLAKDELRDGSSKLGIRLSVAHRFELVPLCAALKGEPADHLRVQIVAHGSEASYKRSHLKY